MKTLKYLSFLLLFTLFSFGAAAQDAIVIDTGNFIRGTVQGTDYSSVSMKTDDGTVTQYQAKDIKEFLWNGVTFVSKPFVRNKRTEYRFFKLVEAGTVNLYAMGGNTGNEKQKRRRLRFMPSIGLGIGTGGGGFGFGGGLSFGGGVREDEDQPARDRRALYYLERPGTGDMLEITPDGNTANTKYIREALLEKLSGDADLAERISKTDDFDIKTIQTMVKNYNSVHQ